MNTMKHETHNGKCSGIMKKGDDFDNKEHCMYVIGKKSLDEGFEFKIRSFLTHMRPLLITDGAHLKGTYKGTNLVLVGMDGNNQIIPIATGNILEDMQAYTQEEFQRRLSSLRGFRPEAYKKLEEAGFETWSRAMCPANRYNYMTSNNAESINNLTRHVRKAPITQLMEWYRALLQWYCARREKYKDSTVDDRQRVHKVDLTTRLSTCRKWQLSGIPCGHVIAVGRTMGCTDCSKLALCWFRQTTLYSTYQELAVS
ncbi:transposase, MuDR, MULE transposase domain protein [Tanacetum coccineum]